MNLWTAIHGTVCGRRIRLAIGAQDNKLNLANRSSQLLVPPSTSEIEAAAMTTTEQPGGERATCAVTMMRTPMPAHCKVRMQEAATVELLGSAAREMAAQVEAMETTVVLRVG